MNKQCTQCSKTFRIDDQDASFYKKIAVPHPTQCPDCREQRRLVWHNERAFYQGTCALCKRDIITMYALIPENEDLTIYCQECWQSDKWDATDYAIQYDQTKSFMNQYYELQRLVPRAALSNNLAENSPYMNWADRNKNCYMGTSANDNEDCYYGFFMVNNTDCCDITYSHNNRLSYELIDCENCNQVRYAQDSRDCNESWFLYDCVGVSNSFGCTNLRMKQYYIFNEPYTPEVYTKKVAELTKDRASLATALELFTDLKKKAIQRPVKGFKNIQITGGGITNSYNAKHSFEGFEIIDSAYIFQSVRIKDSYDLSFVDNAELCYETHSNIGSNVKFSNMCRRSLAIEYCDTCLDSSDLFGCVGLRKKRFHILNTVYSQEEYLRLCKTIINDMKARGEYGEFFSGARSFFAYNETLANDIYPLTRNEVIGRGWRWHDALKAESSESLQTIVEFDESGVEQSEISKITFGCSGCDRPYKMIVQELDLYERLGVVPPTLCFYCRERARQELRNPWKLFTQQCMCTQTDHASTGSAFHQGRCTIEFETNYAPDNSAIIYCENCYQKEIY